MGAIDHAILKIVEVAPAGAAGVGDRSDADAESEAIGILAVIAVVRVAPARARIDVHVDVDEAGSDVEAGDIDDLPGLRGIDVGRDLGDAAVADRHVADFVDVILGVDNVAALEKKIVRSLGESGGQKKQQECSEFHGQHSTGWKGKGAKEL